MRDFEAEAPRRRRMRKARSASSRSPPPAPAPMITVEEEEEGASPALAGPPKGPCVELLGDIDGGDEGGAVAPPLAPVAVSSAVAVPCAAEEGAVCAEPVATTGLI